MKEAGLSLSVRFGRLDEASGEKIVAAIAAQGELPEALIAANNLVAVGAAVELRRQGRSIPKDVGLACFGDLALASRLDPFLTAVREPAYELGRAAMEMLQARLDGSTEPPHHQVLPVQLIARRSTCRT
jgi:DNA-binding LacI/PurR family transcriptional regulator